MCCFSVSYVCQTTNIHAQICFAFVDFFFRGRRHDLVILTHDHTSAGRSDDTVTDDQ